MEEYKERLTTQPMDREEKRDSDGLFEEQVDFVPVDIHPAEEIWRNRPIWSSNIEIDEAISGCWMLVLGACHADGVR